MFHPYTSSAARKPISCGRVRPYSVFYNLACDYSHVQERQECDRLASRARNAIRTSASAHDRPRR